MTGDTGVYLQYAHARAAGVLRKVDDDGRRIEAPVALHAAERELLHSIEAYPRALQDTAVALSPSVLTAYAFSLASAFSDFYGTRRRSSARRIPPSVGSDERWSLPRGPLRMPSARSGWPRPDEV